MWLSWLSDCLTAAGSSPEMARLSCLSVAQIRGHLEDREVTLPLGLYLVSKAPPGGNVVQFELNSNPGSST